MREWLVGVALCGVLAVHGVGAEAKAWNNPLKGKNPGLEHHTFQSPKMGIAVGYNICLPREYRAEPSRRFPVVYYLHGYEGNESSYIDYAKYWQAESARIPPCILVFANGGGTSFFSDSPDGSVMGETVVKELVAAIDSGYRTVPQPAGRSLHGYSMGGFGALKLGFKYPDMFGSVVAYGATLSTPEEMQEHLGKVYKRTFGSRAQFEANDPLAILETHADAIRAGVAVQMIIGTKDEFLAANRKLAERLKALKVQTDYIELAGVKHDKDPLYEQAASRAFEFSAKKFGGAGKEKPARK